ncbi:MAG: site-2 protease family protein [Acidimicrobiaceae bacterium]|nr:site-2 protease family protein [Acidimicrobiaceae bacterium]
MTRKSLVLLVVVAAVFVVADLRHVISGDAIILLAVLVPSVILHEVSHGYVAMLFGDDTAKRAGRLTLNPIAHIDPVGSFLLPALLIFAGLTPIGYAKPVPVNISKLRSPRNQSVLVSLSGPAVNIILSVVAGILLHLRISQAMAPSGLFPVAQITLGPSLLDRVLFNMGAINLLLGVFNLIPIPPLDGSAVIERVLPADALARYFHLRRLMLPVVLVLFLVFPGVIGSVFTPIIDLWIRIFAQ